MAPEVPPSSSAVGSEAEWDKTDIIHFLSELYDYKNYLEFCTSTTGARYDKIRKSRFTRSHRLMYRCPDDFDDGGDIEFKSSTLETRALFDEIDDAGFRYDIILVDPFHTYDISYRDLVSAMNVLSDGGSIVVHDCLPSPADSISPEFVPGPWCGVTFIAFVDFVRATHGLSYLTVDIDCGCGIIRPGAPRALAPTGEQWDAWSAVRGDPSAAYNFLVESRGSVLNLLSVDAFKAAELERSRSHLLAPRDYG